jgi:tetratricopeptide (TPR) repeat protein
VGPFCYDHTVKRLVAVLLVGGGALSVAVFAYTTVAREREYRQLIAAGEAALAANETYSAIEAFSGALALKGDSMVAFVKRGEAYERRGELTSALRDHRAATELDPAATRPIEALGDVNYALGRYARAAEAYEQYVALDDRSAQVLYKLGVARFRDGKAAAAIPRLREAIALDDQLAEGHYLLALCLREQSQNTEAKTHLRQAIALAPAMIQAREELAAMSRDQGHTADEIDQLNALAALEPQRTERQVALGLAYARAGRTDLAVLTLGRAAERGPEQPQVFTALGRVWLEIAERGNDRVARNKAIIALQQAVAAGANSSEAFTLLGRALVLAGRIDQAQRLFEQAISTLPADPAAFLALADLAERRGQTALARESLVKYLALAGESRSGRAQQFARVGSLSLRLNEPAVAAGWFRRASGAAPADTALVARLVDAEWRAGRRELSRDILKRALDRTPGDPSLRTLQQRLK